MNEKIVFGQYINKNSLIHKIDPRAKILSLFILMIGVFLLNNIYALLISLAFNIILILLSKISILKFIKSFRVIAMLLIFSTVFQIIFNRSGGLISIGNIELKQTFNLTWLSLSLGVLILLIYFLGIRKLKKGKILLFLVTLIGIFAIQTIPIVGPVITKYDIGIYEAGFNIAVIVLLRIINLLVLSGLLTFTTKPTDMNKGIEGIFYPIKPLRRVARILGMMISITIRYIPTLLAEASKVLKAQASRGVDFNEGSLKDKVVQIISLLVPMFIISYKKSEDLANAMLVRGYVPGDERTSIYKLKYSILDFFVFLITILLLTFVILLKVKGVV